MDTNKNSYTIIYTAVMVIVVAAVLAFVSSSLKGKQTQNAEVDTKSKILGAVALTQGMETASNKSAFVEQQYEKYVTEDIAVNAEGQVIEGVTGFSVDLKTQNDLMKAGNTADLQLPVFVCTMDNGSKVYILSCYGAGLWGPIWGWIALESDMDTVHGTLFAHKGETPGLGAEIATEWFSAQFNGKKIFEGDEFTSVRVIKGGAAPDDIHGVDAITGGTMTSRALDSTIETWLKAYMPYIESVKAANAPAVGEIASDSLAVAVDSLAVAAENVQNLN